MAAIVLALGLMLSGVFTVGGGIMGLGQAMTARRDWVGAFFTGALAVVVATPCTAPFMGSAMAYAVSQPFIVSLLVFEALALGLAAPFLLVSLVPAIAYLIPKPGAWMDTFKQILAFPMYATAAWLVWVLTQQTGPDGVAAALAGLVLVALALWIYGHGQRMGAARPVNVTAGIAAAALALAALVQVGCASRMTAASAPEAVAGLSSEPFTEARLAALRAEGRPVFVNFTAAWCITCLVNERMAFSSADVIDAMTQKKVVYLKADWTNYDPAISKVLAAYGRVGVPLYLYFAPNAGKAEILPQILTPGALTAALAGGVATR
jgi:thiol:disulfide interchange protein DsbD